MLTPEKQKNPVIGMNSMFYLKSPSAAAAELTGIHDFWNETDLGSSAQPALPVRPQGLTSGCTWHVGKTVAPSPQGC